MNNCTKDIKYSFQKIVIAKGELKAVKGDYILATNNLGSCVSIVLLDAHNSVGGIIHFALPYIGDYPNYNVPKIIASKKIQYYKVDRIRKKSFNQFQNNSAMYADTSIPLLLEQMLNLGAKKHWIEAKIIGGADMFNTSSVEMDIGKKNVEAAKEILRKYGILILAEDVGGNSGKSIEFNVSTGTVKIISGKGECRYI